MQKPVKLFLILFTAVCYATTSFAQLNLTAETASPGGAPHMSMSHLAEVVGAAGIANLQVQAGQTLTNTVINVAEGKTDIGVTPLVLPFLLNLGRGPYSKQGKKGKALASNLRALYPYNFGAYHLFGFQSEGITSWEQLKGKTIYNGPPRGGALVGARQILQLVAGIKEGEDYNGVQVNWAQANKTILDNTADINLLPGTFPSDRIITALSAGKVNVLSVPKKIWESERFQKFAGTPGNAPLAIPASAIGYGNEVEVISEDGVFRTVKITGAEIVHKKMDAQLVQSMVAEYIKTIEAFKARAPFLANIDAAVLDATSSGFCGLTPLKYHPGAIVAWEEAGYKIPDCAKP